MAMHYRPPPAEAPVDLVAFDAVKWYTLGDTGWIEGFRLWRQARHAFAEEHPDGNLGDLVDCLRGEVRVRRILAGD
jgi:hypothetical protein